MEWNGMNTRMMDDGRWVRWGFDNLAFFTIWYRF